MIIERLFGLTGLRDMMIRGYLANDSAMIITVLIIFILTIVIVYFFIDISYGFLDPRVRIGGSSKE